MQNGLFNVTEEQQSLVELIRDFMTKEIKPLVLEWEKEGHYPQEIIEQGIEEFHQGFDSFIELFDLRFQCLHRGYGY